MTDVAGLPVPSRSEAIKAPGTWEAPIVTTLVASVAGVLFYALVATVVGQPHLVTTHLLVVAAVVGIFNALAAPFALRMVRWSIAGPERAYI